MKDLKIVTIGDVQNGISQWKNIADIKHLLKAQPDAAGFGPFEPEFDYYIFIGDYVDNHESTNEQILESLQEVIRFKQLYPKNVILLWGNHDIQYYLGTPAISSASMFSCSGYRPEMHYDLYDLFRPNYKLFQLAFQIENYLWTHAGVHSGWLSKRFKKPPSTLPEFSSATNSMAAMLNYAFERPTQYPELFDVCHHRGGRFEVGGPLWLHVTHYDKGLTGFTQIVGHNHKDTVRTFGKPESRIVCVDALPNEYLEIISGNLFIKKV
jgi:hypothetical protein